MELGLFGINMGRYALDPEAAVALARAAEASGWESVWAGEHFVLPDPTTPEAPAPPDLPILDAWIALAHIAAATTSLLVATGVTVVPLHHPLALAKQAVSLDRTSGGRLVLGVGVGYLEPELAAFGVSPTVRGAATDQTLDVLAAAWRDPTIEATYLGTTITGLRAEPRPIRPDGPPLVVGGASRAAFRRAVRRGHGWYGWDLDVEGAQRAVAALHALAGEVERPGALGPLEITVTPPHRAPVGAAMVERYRAAGVDRLVLHVPRGSASDALAFVEAAPTTLLGS